MYENGTIYDSIKQKCDCIIFVSRKALKQKNGEYRNISLKTLYRNVFGKPFCIDTIESLNGEEWKQINNTDYFISNFGRIKSYKRIYARLLKPNKRKNNYLYVSLDKKNYRIHRLVATAFVYNDNPKEKREVHHIDFNT